MRRIAIERRSGLSPEVFARDHLAGGGRPVIITDAVARWPARAKWTFEYLTAAYGSDLVQANPSIFSRVAKVTKLAEYLRHIDSPQDVSGIWVNVDTRLPAPAPADTALPLYLLGWYAFQAHPELYADIAPAPSFTEDWVLALSDAERERAELASTITFWSLYIGPTGSLSQLHQDFGHTHSYLAQIDGRKRAVCFAPTDSERLYGGAVDPEQPDLDKFPLLADATAYVGEIGPGDLLFTPSDWWHHVRGLSPSITVSHNFFNASNIGAYLGYLLDLK